MRVLVDEGVFNACLKKSPWQPIGQSESDRRSGHSSSLERMATCLQKLPQYTGACLEASWLTPGTPSLRCQICICTLWMICLGYNLLEGLLIRSGIV